MSPKDSLHLLYICLSTDIHKQLLAIHPQYISKWISRSSYIKKLVKYIHAFCPTLSWFPYSPSFPMHWPSRTHFLPVSLPSMLAGSIRERLLRYSHPATLCFPDPECHCLALYQIQPLLRNRLCCHLDYPSHYCGLANFGCLKWFQVCYPHHFRFDDHQFI